jgi:tripartite-type tricarboxylate transporter receptor subunit TctC
MRLARICFFVLALTLVLGFEAWAADVKKEEYPVKPITLLVAYEPGSTADLLVRPLAEKAAARLGVPIVIVNKPGAGGAIGGKEIHDAKADGYTLGAYNGMVHNKLQGLHPFDHRSFDMIGVYNTSPSVIIVNAERPWKSAKELIDYAKAHPREVKAATSSKGGLFWVSAVVFEKATGVKLNLIPQTGAGAMVTLQVAGGHVDIGFQDIPTAKSQLAAGKVKLLAVFSPKRLEEYPDVPTLAELGYNVETRVLRAILAPRGIPSAAYQKLVAAFGQAAQDAEYVRFARQQDTIPLWLASEEGARAFDDEQKLLRPVIEEAGLLKEKK